MVIDALTRPISLNNRLSDVVNGRYRLMTRYGAGKAVATCIDLEYLADKWAEGTSSFLLTLITGGSSTGATASQMQYSYMPNWRTRIPRWANDLLQITDLSPISRAVIILYLLAFVVIVCPIERRIRPLLPLAGGAATPIHQSARSPQPDHIPHHHLRVGG